MMLTSQVSVLFVFSHWTTHRAMKTDHFFYIGLSSTKQDWMCHCLNFHLRLHWVFQKRFGDDDLRPGQISTTFGSKIHSLEGPRFWKWVMPYGSEVLLHFFVFFYPSSKPCFPFSWNNFRGIFVWRLTTAKLKHLIISTQALSFFAGGKEEDWPGAWGLVQDVYCCVFLWKKIGWITEQLVDMCWCVDMLFFFNRASKQGLVISDNLV